MLYKEILEDNQFIWSIKRNVTLNSLNNVLHFHKVNCSSENKDYFVRNFILKYKKAKNKAIFMRNEDNFLTKSLEACSEIIIENITETTTQKVKIDVKDSKRKFETLSIRSKYRRTKKIRSESYEALKFALDSKINTKSDKKVIVPCLQVKRLKKALRLTKRQYLEVKIFLRPLGIIFPTLKKLRASIKKSIPNNILVTSQEAKVSLQSLVDKTVQSILSIPEVDEKLALLGDCEGKLELESKGGGDGQRLHSEYKVKIYL
jgi:hypothetical protein